MATRLLRGSDSAVSSYYGSLGEVVVNTDNDSIHIMDGVTQGGFEVPNEITIQSVINQSITTYASTGSFPTSSVAFLPEADFEAALPNTTGTASDPNTEVIQWDGSKFYIATAPASSGGGGGTNPTSATTTGSVMVWTGSAWAEDATFATQTYVNTEVAQVKTDILGGATAAYDTLQEIKGFIDTNASNIGTILTNVATKITKPGTSTPANHAVAWDASANAGAGDLVNVDLSVYAPKPSATTTTDHAIVWDASLGWQEVDLSVFALDTDLATKATKPAASSGAGEFLRWDATANSGAGGFIHQVPSGSGGTTIPTPTTTTDTANKEVLVWDQTLSSLKNETSDFALVNGATTLTDLAAVESAVNAKADAPPAQTTSGTYLYHDGSAWQYGTPSGGGGSVPANPASSTQANEVVTWNGTAYANTSGYAMLSDLSAKAPAPTVATGSSEVLKWDQTNQQFLNVALSSTGFTSTGAITPPTNTGASEYLAWDGINGVFENRSGFVTDTNLTAKLPTAPSLTNEVVKWNGSAFENVLLSNAGFTNMGSITPPTGSSSTDVLQWDATNSQFINVSGFARIDGASTYTTIKALEDKIVSLEADLQTALSMNQTSTTDANTGDTEVVISFI